MTTQTSAANNARQNAPTAGVTAPPPGEWRSMSNQQLRRHLAGLKRILSDARQDGDDRAATGVQREIKDIETSHPVERLRALRNRSALTAAKILAYSRRQFEPRTMGFELGERKGRILDNFHVHLREADMYDSGLRKRPVLANRRPRPFIHKVISRLADHINETKYPGQAKINPTRGIGV